MTRRMSEQTQDAQKRNLAAHTSDEMPNPKLGYSAAIDSIRRYRDPSCPSEKCQK